MIGPSQLHARWGFWWDAGGHSMCVSVTIRHCVRELDGISCVDCVILYHFLYPLRCAREHTLNLRHVAVYLM